MKLRHPNRAYKYKKKRHSCAMCKYYKMRGANRWDAKMQAGFKAAIAETVQAPA